MLTREQIGEYFPTTKERRAIVYFVSRDDEKTEIYLEHKSYWLREDEVKFSETPYVSDLGLIKFKNADADEMGVRIAMYVDTAKAQILTAKNGYDPQEFAYKVKEYTSFEDCNKREEESDDENIRPLDLFSIDKNRIAYFISLIATAFVGVLIAKIMKSSFGELSEIYSDEAGQMVMPPNFGFRTSTIWGMMAVLLFQFIIFSLCYYKKEYKKWAWMLGINLSEVIMFDELNTMSNIYYTLEYRDLGIQSDVDLIWYIFRLGNILILTSFCVFFIYLFIKSERERKTSRVRTAVEYFALIVCASFGIIALYFQTVKNRWYFICCIVTWIISWIVLTEFEKHGRLRSE